jgi:release factor glutamine methyltransferase
MTVSDYLSEMITLLTAAGIATARLDALVLLEDCLGKDRAHLLAHPETELADEQISTLKAQIKRRIRHVPLAYIRGKTEFYGRDFKVNEHVLEPRPESETMISLLKNLPNTEGITIVDVGTGSGALAITAKLEMPHADVIAIDIDPRCLEVARQNAILLKTDIRFEQGNLLTPLVDGQPDNYALLCNLPYVPDDFQINTAATHEPRLAIYGGPDGLTLYRELFRQLLGFTRKPTYILTEAMPPQHEQLIKIAEENRFKCVTSEDFIEVFAPKQVRSDNGD